MRIALTSTTCAALFGLAALFTTSAQATELCTGPAITGVSGPIANGSSCGLAATQSPILAMFIGFNAADTDALVLPGVSPNPIFVNQGPGASAIGATVSLNVPLTGLNFMLDNMSTGVTYNIATPYVNSDDPTSVVYHFADFTFRTGANDAADEALYNSMFPTIQMTSGEFATIEANGGFANWTFVGVEDLATAAQDDWNDIVYGFQSLAPTVNTVAEPLTLSLFGAGLMGVGLMRRRKANSASKAG